MMVFDPIANNNKAATSVSSSSPKLDADDKKTPKRGNSTKRVSDNLKRSIAKELTSPKDVGRSRSSSPSPRSTSGKSHKSSKDKKEKKKKKKKNRFGPVLSQAKRKRRRSGAQRIFWHIPAQQRVRTQRNEHAKEKAKAKEEFEKLQKDNAGCHGGSRIAQKQ